MWRDRKVTAMNRRLALALVVCGSLLLGVFGCDPENTAGGPATARPSSPRPRPGYPTAMAALGDSITAGVSACLAMFACQQDSWATGTAADVNSHYQRILAANPAIRGHQHNFAESGAVAADLPGQARAAVAAKVQYVAILVGANDACAKRVDDMTSTAQFGASVTAALKVLRLGLPAARVLVVSIPDVYRVWQVAHTDSDARLVWRLGICQSLLANPTSTAPADVARRQAVRDRIDAYDAQLAAACRSAGPHCRYDGGAVHRYAFAMADLSTLDYFHPNVRGQHRLAELTYPGSFR